MKKSRGILTALVLMSALLLLTFCDRSQRDGVPVSFNDGWLFIRQDSANADKILPGIIPNHKWEEASLPHTAFIEPLDSNGRHWTGICWYKKLYRPERNQKHKHTGLLFEGAMNDAIVYLNGAEIACHTGGYLPFYVNLTDDLEYGKENEILVRLDNRENPALPAGKPLEKPDIPWYSGLYRNVNLYVTDKLHLTNCCQSNTTPGGGIITGVRDMSRESATLTLSAQVSNDDHTPRAFRMKNILLDAGGLEVASSLSELTELEPGQSQRLMTRMIIMQPSLWTPETPFLYTIRTELQSDNGAVIDRRETRTGIRTVRITPENGLTINSQPVRIIGTTMRQEYPYIGYALSDDASYRDAFKIREAGFNMVRIPHYPPSQAFLNACDELGLMVIADIPGWPFTGDSLLAGIAERDTRMICRRDRNHPSIIVWKASLTETSLSESYPEALCQIIKEELPFGNNHFCSRMDTLCDLFIPATEASDIMDIFRQPKFAYWFFRSQYDQDPVCFIAHHNLSSSGNTVKVYSNADTIRLFQNDTLIAVKGPDSDSVSVKLPHPPFTFTIPEYVPGTIRASAIRKGNVIASDSVTTPGTPVALRLTADFSNKPLQGGGADVVFVYASLIDSNDNPVHTADSLVEFTVRGNAELIGSNPVKAEAGIASILLRAINPGRIMIKASSAGISDAELMTEAR